VSAADRTAAKNKLPRVEAAIRRLGDVKNAVKAFEDNRIGTSPLTGSALSLTREGNALDVANAMLLAETTALTRIPGVGAQSDFEQRLQAMVLPSTSNFDEANEIAISELDLFMADLQVAVRNVAENTNDPLPSSFIDRTPAQNTTQNNNPVDAARQQAVDVGATFFVNPETNQVEAVNP
jgi:hypothetical protein